MAFLLLRVYNKHTKDCSSSLLRDQVFGIYSEYQNHDCGSSCNRDERNPACDQGSTEQNSVFEGALPASGQVSTHEASSVQGTITLSSTSVFENFNDEIWTDDDHNSTRSPERPDLVAHIIANASLLPDSLEGDISSHRI